MIKKYFYAVKKHELTSDIKLSETVCGPFETSDDAIKFIASAFINPDFTIEEREEIELW
ncbi:MAG: hypothetical protein ABFD79_05355 [Phycisphaerales bacterium]|jgi:hypothetical protein